MPHAVMVDARRSESTWASSDGGPGLNRGAHMAGRSMFGTKGGDGSTFLRSADSVTQRVRTEKPFCGLFEVWFGNLGLDAAYDGRVSEADECRAVCGRDGPHVHKEVAPVGCLTTVRAELLCEKAFEIGLWMKSLEDVGVEVGHVDGRQVGDGITKPSLSQVYALGPSQLAHTHHVRGQPTRAFALRFRFK